MKEEKNSDFLQIGRKIFRMYEGGDLSFSELIVLLWLYYKADARGVVHIRSHGWFAGIVPVKILGNTFGKMIKKFESHKLINYKSHQGSTSGFKVYIIDWRLKNGSLRKYREDFSGHEIISESQDGSSDTSQVETEVDAKNHKYSLTNELDNAKHSSVHDSKSDTCDYNDNNNDNYNSIDISIAKSEPYSRDKFKFEVDSSEDERMLRVAEKIDEGDMRFILSIYRDYGENGLQVMEKVAVDLIDRSSVDNKRKYFNKVVRKILEKNSDIGKAS
ncbi:hypothetical protein N8083_01380 [Candidatus Pacebacteria bacterium]|nr:hypothetical protein [Candidatus Paceibacterota bacterium]